MKRPVIFDYLDYRAFLKDMFCFRKWKDKHFSYRYFAGKSGFASPNYLKLVIDGARNLTNGSIAKIAKGFKLKKQEREYFENLVFMNQAGDHDERDHYYRKMMSSKGYGHVQRIEKASYDYFSKWYYPVIREVVQFGDRRHTPRQIASLLSPSIKPKEAEKALELLVELGLIRKDAKGRWEQCDKVVSTGPEVKSLVIANFHREMMQLGAKSIDSFPADQRDISGVTISTKKENMNEIKKKIAAFREEILELACSDKDDDQVVQINIQAFPLTSRN
jgi:uncharacterized protein (TIGR02147 family)